MKNKQFPIIIGKTQSSSLIDEQVYTCLNPDEEKSPMGSVIGKSGTGKTFTLVGMALSMFINSIKGNKNNKISIIDAHMSSIPRVLQVNGELYNNDPSYTRTSNVSLYCHTTEKKLGYDPINGSVRKVFIFNPLVPFGDGYGGYVPTELQIEWFISSLQGVFAESDFGARNILAINTVMRMFLAFNKEIIEGKIDGPFFTLKDLAELFIYLSNNGKLPDYVDHNISNIDVKISDTLRPSLRKMVQNVKTDKSFFDSANTKLGIFLLESNERTLGVNIGPENKSLLFDMAETFLKPQTETSMDLFDLSKFGDEKSIIASCLITASYHFGKRRPLPAINSHTLIVDEFQGFTSIRSKSLYFIVQKILFESRKFGIGIIPVFQDLTDDVKTLFSNFGFVLIFALRTDAALKVVEDLNAGIQGNIEILPEHVSNLEQGQFFTRIDTKKNGVLTLLSKSIDFTKKSELMNIFSKFL